MHVFGRVTHRGRFLLVTRARMRDILNFAQSPSPRARKSDNNNFGRDIIPALLFFHFDKHVDRLISSLSRSL